MNLGGRAMGRDELLRLFDAGDFYGLMLGVNAAWLAKDHPACRWACLVADVLPGAPAVRVVIPGFASASASPPLGEPHRQQLA
jgi:hypothetical protein